MTWYMVVSTGRVQGVFGSALFDDAKRCADKIVKQTGLPARVVSFAGDRPSVGNLCPMPRAEDCLYDGRIEP